MYFKITNENENHNDFQYKTGLNVWEKDLDGTERTGLFFADITNIFYYLNQGCYLREVMLPKIDEKFRMRRIDFSYCANKIILGKKYNLSNVSTFEYLISLGANINNSSVESHPIIWAANRGYVNIIKFLVDEHNVKPDIHNYLAIKRACEQDHCEAIKYFTSECKYKNDIPYLKKCIDTALLSACENNSVKIITYIFSCSSLRKLITMYSGTLEHGLKIACTEGYLQIVKLLTVNNYARYREYKRNMKIACKYGHIEIVKYLYLLCIPIKYDMVLFEAARGGNDDIVEFLVNNKCDPNHHEAYTAAMRGYCNAKTTTDKTKYENIIKIFIENNVDPLKRNNKILMLACSKGTLEIVQYIIPLNATSHAKLTANNSKILLMALKIAKKNNNWAVYHYLNSFNNFD